MKNKKLMYLGTSAILIILFIVASMIFKNNRNEEYSFIAKKQNEIFVRDYAPKYGDRNAKVYLIEFLDPECESCRSFYPTVKELLKEFEGKVQLVVRYAPFHGNSKMAIKALEAARLQGKYWESLQVLFTKQPQWGSHHNPQPERIFDFLAELGLDMEKLKSDMDSPKIADIIKQDLDDLRVLGVRKTPTFFVNGMLLTNFGKEYLRDLLNSEVNKVY
jgi:protein-disulfide isomerase